MILLNTLCVDLSCVRFPRMWQIFKTKWFYFLCTNLSLFIRNDAVFVDSLVMASSLLHRHQ